MRIEKTKPKKGVTELPAITKELIHQLQTCSDDELVGTLKGITVWRYGKCELYHWIEVLDRFDAVLEVATRHESEADPTSCIFMCPKLEDHVFKEKVETVLNFTALLIEHSYARHIYNSTEHLCVLLACPDLDVVLAVLNLFYVFSKRSNFISRLPPKQRTNLNSYLEYLGETWGGKQNGFGLAECCQSSKVFPSSCTTVYFEYQPAGSKPEAQVGVMKGAESIVLEAVDKMFESIPQLMASITAKHKIPVIKQMQLLTRLRLARNFHSDRQRLKCVMARLQAISILVYSVAPAEVVDPLIYDGFVEELVEVLEIKSTELMDIRAAVLRTLTAIIHLERDPRLGAIIEATGASTYHGFLPSLVRDCVAIFTGPGSGETLLAMAGGGAREEFPLTFATALFSFLYHLATYEASGDALVSSGIMESLLQVLEWKAFEPMNITLVTRAVRVIDLITNLDMSAFHSLGGWNKMLLRLEMEIQQCNKEAPFILSTEVKPAQKQSGGSEGSEARQPSEEGPAPQQQESQEAVPMETQAEVEGEAERGEGVPVEGMEVVEGVGEGVPGCQCMPERAALIKSILNFLKKAIPDPTFAENIRNFVDSSLPQSLKHIVSNAEYYGPSIYLPATEVTTVFVFHEPSQLTPLQDNGLPGIVLNSVINKQIPVTREVLASLPNILSALCLNNRGLQVFINAAPFDHLFGVLISPDYLPAMRKKKGTDQIGDTASNLGIAMDELMRHQPTLRSNVIAALIRLLKRLCEMGSAVGDQKQSGTGESEGGSVKRKISVAATAGEDHMSSDSENEKEEEEEEEEEEERERASRAEGEEGRGEGQDGEHDDEGRPNKSPLPLSEYVINVVHFVDSILSNNSTDDHIREFIQQGGLGPLLRLLSLPALPLDFPSSSACSAITSTCRNILNISHSPELLQESLGQLSDLLKGLGPFLASPQSASSSVLLDEVGPLSHMTEAIHSPVTTPLLHRMVAVNAFIQLFIHLSRASQVGYNIDSRALCVTHWASALGHSVLQQLSLLYRALVWEGFILLAVASDEDRAIREEGTKSQASGSDSQTSTGTGSRSQSDSQSSKDRDFPADSQEPRLKPATADTISDSTPFTPLQSIDSTAPESMDTTTTTTATTSSQATDHSSTSTVSSKPTSKTAASPAPSILVESLKQLTPLLSITSRVGRSLAELMSLLVRVCMSPLHRPHRRGPSHILIHHYHPPSEDAIGVCLEVTNLLVDSLKWEVPMPQTCRPAMQSPIRDWLFGGMTFKMYAVDFCELLLYDEHKQAYHMMQHAFQQKSALEAFISTFHTAIKIVNGSTEMGAVYGSCIDFLDAWLNLAEKLVNAAAILESSHSLPIPPPSQAEGKKLFFNPIFNPLAFVIKAQKAVLPCLQELWESPQLRGLSPKVVALLISTVRHFYSSEKVIEAKLAEMNLTPTDTASSSGGGAQGTSSASSSSSSGGAVAHIPAPPVPRVDPLYLQQLSDMGFTREHAEEALLACGNDLPSAMEWILSHPPSSEQIAVLSEEEQIMRAIALSLGENKTKDEGKGEGEGDAEEEQKKKKKEEEERERQRQREREELRPLDRSLLDDFSTSLLPGCIEIASSVADSVYRVCDLVAALAKRNGESWRSMALGRVKGQVLLLVHNLIDQIEAGSYTCGTTTDPGVDPVACQIHLLALLMEEMPLSCVQVVCDADLLSSCIRLLHLAQTKVCSLSTSTANTPRWLGPLLLLLDLWEKTVLLAKWHRPPREGVQVVWQWFENVHGRWCSYSQENAQQIEKAYQDKEPCLKIASGRQRYVIQFGPMVQVNVESNTVRPVVRLEIPKKSKNGTEKSAEKPESSVSTETEATTSEVPPECHSMEQEQAHTAISCCTRLLSARLDPDTLHANLRLCLRLTRQPELAAVFAKEGGPQALLSLTHGFSFKGFTSLAALLFRHCLEEGPLLKQAVESVIRSVVTSHSSSGKEVRAQGMGNRELFYVLRRLGPCACRSPELFTDAACSILRMNNQPPKSENYFISQRVPPTTVKCCGPPRLEPVHLNYMQRSVINLLIDHLCTESVLEDPSEKSEAGNGGGEGMKVDEDVTVAESVPRQFQIGISVVGNQGRRMRHGSYRRQLTGNYDIDDDVASEDMNADAELALESGGTTRQSSSNGSTETAKNGKVAEAEKPLLSRAAVLRLLAELVESYPACARLIADSSRKIKVDGLPAKVMPVLAFIFDHLLSASFSQSSGVPAIAKLSKTFLQCLATAHYSPEAISTLVVEFKMAFSRALALPDSQAKHTRVRALMGLLSQILDAQNVYPSRGSVNPSHFARLLIRKGFISDLTRAIHSLNMSSTLLPATINSILKPLEVLTRIVNQVASTQKTKESGESKSVTDSRPTTSAGQANMSENETGSSQSSRLPQDTSAATAAPATTGDSDRGTLAAPAGHQIEPAPSQLNSGQESLPADESILEATHESLIPLEEEEEEEVDISVDALVSDSVDADLLEEAVSLAREIGRHHGAIGGGGGEEGGVEALQSIVDELLEREPGGGGTASGAILSEVILHSPSDGRPGVTDSDDSSEDDSLSDSEDEEGEEEGDIGEDNFNSAGEELDDEEFDESHVGVGDGVLHISGVDDIGSDLSDAESTQDETETEVEEGEGESEGESSVGTSAGEGLEEEEEEESMVLEVDGGEDDGGDLTGDVAVDREGPFGALAVEEEDEEEEEEGGEEGIEDDELDLEYDYDEEDDEGTDYLRVDLPWGMRGDPELELSLHPSFLTRAYHTRPMQHSTDYDQSSSSTAHTLPQYHPLLVRHADHPQQQSARATSAGPRVNFDSPNSPDMQHEAASAMQQLLSNISAAAGTNEVLSFGVGTSGTQRNRTGAQSVQSKAIDDGSESTTIPTIQARWEEESSAVDGHAAHLCIANLREHIISTLTTLYEEANKPKEPKPTDASASSKTQGGEQSGQASASGGGSVPTVPHPSDQATPASPRDPSSTVDQLRSSLRQVADALAQTVAAVRETRQLLGRSSESATEEAREGEEVVAMDGDLRQPADETGQMETSQAVETVENESEIVVGQEVVGMETVETQQEVIGMETSEVDVETTSADVTEEPSSSAHRPVPPLIPATTSASPPTSQQQQRPSTVPAVVAPAISAPAMTSASTSASSEIVSHDTHDHPILATFDGSQESARATLASTDPEDPLYTFLSAVAGAPTPPVTETSAPLSPPSIPSQPATTSPRLPVFAQFQSGFGATSSTESQAHPTSSTAIPMSVIQDARNLGSGTVSGPLESPLPSSEAQSSSQTPSSAATTASTYSELQALSDTATDVSSAAANIASQLTTFFETNTIRNLESSEQATDSDATMLEAATLADSLAQQLVRAVSHFGPPTSEDSLPPAAATTSSSVLASTSTVASSSISMQSPSPSDTLAPLISSLQMPTSAAPSGTSVDQSNSEHEVTATEEPGSNLSSQGEQVETGRRLSETVTSERNVVGSESQAEGVRSDSTSEEARQGGTAGQSSSGATAAATGGGGGGGGESSSSSAPDAIDPTFLAALPDSIRHEVMAQYERERTLQQAQQEGFSSSISTDFLSALPSDIQEEVLRQERQERARQLSQEQAPAEPMDNASFFHNLPIELRRTVLSDMDDTMIAHLPEEIASEARALRQERDSRRRQLLEQRHAFLERMIEQAQMNAESSGVPLSSWSHSVDHAGYRYAVLNMNPQHILEGHHHHGGRPGGLYHGGLVSSQPKGEQSSKQMLDQEALTCLLVLLFLDQSRLHNNRLHRIVKNLSQHLPTRAWILHSLLAIIRETSSSSAVSASPGLLPRISATCPLPPPLTPRKGGAEDGSSTGTVVLMSTPVSTHFSPPHWLNISISAALGSHARVFQFEHSGKIGTSTKIHIHPLASITVCNNVLDLLGFLSRQFPASFLPSELMVKDPKDKSLSGEEKEKEETTEVISNFWQVLMRLDGAASRKGKGSLKAFQYSETSQNRTESEVFSCSIVGQLMSLLQHDVIKDSISLTDKLLRVLSFASGPIPKNGLARRKPDKQSGEPFMKMEGSGSSKSRTGTTSDSATAQGGTTSEEIFPIEPPTSVVNPLLLKVVIGVLTSGRCSEDGLDDATHLLTNLSRSSVPTRETILMMLLDGVRTIGQALCSQITNLLDSIMDNMHVLKARRQSSIPETSEEEKPAGASVLAGVAPGIMLPSVNQEQQQHVDHSNDLHLPSMVPLTCKGSQQSFFLRMLKVVCQLRESAQAALQAQERAANLAPASDDHVVPTGPVNPELPSIADLERPSQSESQSQSQSQPGSSSQERAPTEPLEREPSHKVKFMLPPLSLQLEQEELWSTLSQCLDALAETQDPHAVLVLQSTVEAFFLVHADRSEEIKPLRRQRSARRAGRLPSYHTISDTESNPASPAPHWDQFSPMPGTPGPSEPDVDPYAHLPPDTARFLKFAEKHRTVLNQILRQSTVPLSEGPFSVLVSHTRILDFDIKRRYFRQELEQMDEGLRRDDIVLHLRRDHVFEDSFRELYRRTPEELKGNLYIQFEGEEGQDAGGLLREWYLIIAREMFNPNYALFKTTPGDRVTYMPNPSSHVNPNHLNYFKFIGRVIAKAIYDNKLLECYFTRSFYKHILGKPVHYTDMEAEDYSFYQGMVYLLEHDLNELGTELSFSIEINEFGKTETKDIKPNGENIPVTEANKREYVQLACQMKMTRSIQTQIKSFLEGFYEVIPKGLISIFNEQELELLISGLPSIDIDDLKANTEYRKYTENSLQIQWFWRALRSFDQADRARFLQFVTGTSKVPLQGFAALEGMNGVQKFQIHRDDRSTDRLPCAHTCFNQLDLPPYETYDKLRAQMLIAIRECPEGFGLA